MPTIGKQPCRKDAFDHGLYTTINKTMKYRLCDLLCAFSWIPRPPRYQGKNLGLEEGKKRKRERRRQEAEGAEGQGSTREPTGGPQGEDDHQSSLAARGTSSPNYSGLLRHSGKYSGGDASQRCRLPSSVYLTSALKSRKHKQSVVLTLL